MEKLYDVVPVAEMHGLKSSTIRAWLLHRRIGSVRLGRRVKIPESEIARLIAEGFTPAKEDNGKAPAKRAGGRS